LSDFSDLDSINPKTTFALLKPHLNNLIEHFIFPLVCLSEEELETFTDDPSEFARQHFGGKHYSSS